MKESFVSLTDKIHVCFNPTYLCNFRCPHCYILDKVKENTFISPTRLHNMLSELCAYKQISSFNIYGGEVGIIRDSLMDEYMSVIRSFYTGVVEFETNLFKVKKVMLGPFSRIVVGYDWVHREQQDIVYENMKAFPDPFSIISVVTEKFAQTHPERLIEHLNTLPNLESVLFNHYAFNGYVAPCPIPIFEGFIKKILLLRDTCKFEIINEKKIRAFIETKQDLYNDHVTITPYGSWGVVDTEGKFFYREFKSYQEIEQHLIREKIKKKANIFCGSCRFFDICATEQVREVRDLSDSCDGYINLIKWYENELYYCNESTRPKACPDRSVRIVHEL